MYQVEPYPQLTVDVRGSDTAHLAVSILAVILRYNAFQLSAKIFPKLQLFICVEPIIAMFRNERNWVGGAITESYRGQ